MKKQIPITAFVLLTTCGALSQGYVNFSTRVTGTVAAYVYVSGTARAQGAGYSATLWAANGAGQLESSLTLVPGVPAGGTGTFQIRAWNNLNGTLGSYAAADAADSPRGKSDLFDVANLGDGGQNAPANFGNFRSFAFPLWDHPGPLLITATSTNTAVVMWPYYDPSTAALEENSTPGTTNWTNVTNPVSHDYSLSWVVVPVNPGGNFYRLKQ